MYIDWFHHHHGSVVVVHHPIGWQQPGYRRDPKGICLCLKLCNRRTSGFISDLPMRITLETGLISNPPSTLPLDPPKATPAGATPAGSWCIRAASWCTTPSAGSSLVIGEIRREVCLCAFPVQLHNVRVHVRPSPVHYSGKRPNQ